MTFPLTFFGGPPLVAEVEALGITFVGAQQGVQIWGESGQKTFSISGGERNTIQQGDYVVVAYGVTDGFNTAPTVTAPAGSEAYTLIGTGYADDTADTTIRIYGKRMGATPDTTFTLSDTGGNGAARLFYVMVFDGVDPVTPIDAAAVAATTVNWGSPIPFAQITTVTDGAAVVVAGHSTAFGDFQVPVEYDFLQQQKVNPNWLGSGGSGYNLRPTAGAYTPTGLNGVPGSFSSSSQHCAAGVAFALRPAVAPAPFRIVGWQTHHFPGGSGDIPFDLTGEISTPAAGDLVLVGYNSTANFQGTNSGITGSGYTVLSGASSNDTQDATLTVSWKVMGGTPDTVLTVPPVSFDGNIAKNILILVIRGADPVAPIEAYISVEAGFANFVANAPAPVNPPDITTLTNNALVVTLAGTTNFGQLTTTGSDLLFGIAGVGVGSASATAAMAAYRRPTAGAFVTPAFTAVTPYGGGQDSGVAVAMAIKPA